MKLAALRPSILGLTLFALVASVHPAQAGPPLLCHAFDIGTARSLPWSDPARDAWWQGQPGYNLDKLSDDTEALLTAETPIIVRMETLRRAAIYASRDEVAAKRLWVTVNDRVRAGEQRLKGGDALAFFDAGYLAETMKEMSRVGKGGFRQFELKADAFDNLVKDIDGYALVQKSLAMRANDPSIEFASALIASSTSKTRSLYAAHAQKARDGATKDGLLARNLKQISE